MDHEKLAADLLAYLDGENVFKQTAMHAVMSTIRTAVEAERAACARVAERWAGTTAGDEIANRIEARANGEVG